jgi:hypothetical protein
LRPRASQVSAAEATVSTSGEHGCNGLRGVAGVGFTAAKRFFSREKRVSFVN